MQPRILIVYYSRNGHTARLAAQLAQELTARGAEVVQERIHPTSEWAKWWLPVPLLPLLPFLPLYLFWERFRHVWHRVYFQPSQPIAPLAHPDATQFDGVVLGTPKWLYLSYPIAQWLRQIQGLHKKRVFAFATFCGPPLKVFELDMLFLPMREAIRKAGGTPAAELAISSDYHPYFVFNEMRGLFRLLSRWVFKRPLQDFTQDGAVGQAAIQAFCDQVRSGLRNSP